MNDDDLRTQLRRELDSTPSWPLDVDDAAARANPHHRARRTMTALSVVAALAVTVAALVVLSSVGSSPLGSTGSTPSAAPAGGSSAPTTSPATASSSGVATFTCDGSTTTPPMVTVAAGRAGIRIVVDNTSGEDLGFEYELGGGDAPPGEHGVESPDGGKDWALAPGDHRVKCVPNSVTDPDSVAAATLRVVDPNGYWVSNELQCNSNEQFGSNVDFVPGAGWADSDAAVHKALDGYALPGDVIQHVGYPDETGPQYALVRNGRSIVLTTLFRTQGKWLYNGVHGCSGEDGAKAGFRAPIQDR